MLRLTRSAAPGWAIDGEAFDAVVLACSAAEAARLTQGVNPSWSQAAAALRYEPIITAYLASPGFKLPVPMLALDADENGPAQFIFDLGALGRPPGHFALVASGAAAWVERGLAASAQAMTQQARRHFPGAFDGPENRVLLHVAAEHRATFACTPGLRRPPSEVAAGLYAAADYVEGPYPATLEGAIRSAEAAIAAISAP